MAILSSQIVRISQHDLPQYPGSGEGSSYPSAARTDAGRSGICGTAPAEVEDQWQWLLSLCLTQHLERSALAGSQLYKDLPASGCCSC